MKAGHHSKELGGVSEVRAGIHSLGAEGLLNSEDLVVLGESVRSARSAALDLTGAKTDDEVTNEVVLGLTGAVRHHDTPASLL